MASENATNNVTYLSLISQDEKAVKREGLKIKAQEASIQVQTEVMQLNARLAKAKTALAAAQRQIPYSVTTEFAVVKTIQDLEEKLEFVNNIKENRFSDVTI